MTQKLASLYLIESKTQLRVQAELHQGISELSLKQFESAWIPAMRELQPKIALQYGNTTYGAQHQHWDWRKFQKEFSGLLAYTSYSITVNGVGEAFMWLADAPIGRRAKLPGQVGKDLVYVEYLSAAPWNLLIPNVQIPRYKGTGAVLMKAAVTKSMQLGYKGRVGLSALPQSTEFHARFLTRVGPDAHNSRLEYFESSEHAAKRMVEEGTP
ncbi:MAG: hypothetical protein ACRDF4_02380 [Rhabdochlamydiaceae bacterium]